LAALLATQAAAFDNPILIGLTNAGTRVGSATLFQTGNRVLVNVELEDLKVEGAGVEIVEGSCSRLGRPAVELSDTVSGQSQTQIPNTGLAPFLAKPHALVVRKSTRPNAALVACGNVKG
jgi:hypothetical protein